ncbi:MAG: hypothetical protein SWZ49_32845 [Cyanobacteriota bacterium]|nr:hypothetical protein [Cyanobacteriota bacterium]
MKKRSVKQLIFITIFIFCLGFMAAIAMNKSSSNSFLKENGNLIAELEFKDGQSGFVGISGTKWIILPDGTCRGSRFVNDTVSSAHQICQLERQDLASIANSLSKSNFTKLPSEIPSKPTLNPHLLTIRLGEKSSTLQLAAGETIENALQARRNQGETLQTRFLDIALEINQLIQHRCKNN